MSSEIDYQPTCTFQRREVTAHRPPRPPVADIEAQHDLVLADIFDDHGRGESARGRFRAARVLHEQAMAVRRARWGEADPRLSRSFTLLGELSLREGRVDEAAWLLGQAHTAAARRADGDDMHLAATLHNLAAVARRRGEFAESARLAGVALEIKRARLRPEHPSIALTLCALADLARRTGHPREALRRYAQARAIYERAGEDALAGLATALIGMARVHLEQGSRIEARFLLERALRIRDAVVVTPAQSAGVRALLGEAIRDEDPSAARELLRAALREYQHHECACPDRLERLRALAA